MNADERFWVPLAIIAILVVCVYTVWLLHFL